MIVSTATRVSQATEAAARSNSSRGAMDNPTRTTHKQYCVKHAATRYEFQAAFRLVHEAYLQKGLVSPNRCQMRVLPQHLLPTAEVFVGLRQNDVVSTISLIRDSVLGLPLENVYQWEVAQRRSQGLNLAEVSCLADRSQLEGQQSLSEVVKVMSIMVQSAIRRGVDELLIAVHPHHVAFYQRFVGFRVIGEQRSYDSVCNNPAVALALDLRSWEDDYPKGFARFCGNPLPFEATRCRPMPAHLRPEFAAVVEATTLATSIAAMQESLREPVGERPRADRKAA